MGRKRYEPTEADRNTVRSMAATGFPQEHIAKCLGNSGIDPKTLRKHFRSELETSAIMAHAAVANKAYQMAVTGNPPAATFFFLKAQLGWRETGPDSAGSEKAISIEAARKMIKKVAASRPTEDPDEEPISE